MIVSFDVILQGDKPTAWLRYATMRETTPAAMPPCFDYPSLLCLYFHLMA